MAPWDTSDVSPILDQSGRSRELRPLPGQADTVAEINEDKVHQECEDEDG